MTAFLECSVCGSKFDGFPPKCSCENCGGLLEYKYDYERFKTARFTGRFSFWRYRQFMPEVKNAVSMGEGGTPIHKAQRLTKVIEFGDFYFKDETRNPTNSFSDRCATLLVSNALDLGYRSVVCATNGNLGASLAAYCAKFELACHVVVPKSVDVGKLAQMLIYDAVVEEYGDIVDKALERAMEIAEETGWYQGSVELNPLGVEALKTIAYEVFEQIGVPEWFIVPMGSGGTLYAMWKGFKELEIAGKTSKLPKIVGVQAEGCPPIVNAYLRKTQKPFLKMKPSTHALAILVKNPTYGGLALNAIKESKGLALAVSDEEIFLAEREMAKFEGIFAEPASAATYAAAKKLANQGLIGKMDKIVCLITGSGLKATDVLQALTKKRKMAVVGLELSTKEKILKILSERDAYGYELWKELGKVMTRAAVYQHLNELSSRGLITSYERDGRKFFKITKRGEKVLQAFDDLKLLL
ncbi:MAG: threonine synthase [Candidatus Bathyarchaeota archaeon]|nr:threonine synthase [Candidatus Bathyarchaeota archaeon]MDW8040538.1 threonine synthase [Nitrososphaerota archaeon]